MDRRFERVGLSTQSGPIHFGGGISQERGEGRCKPEWAGEGRDWMERAVSGVLSEREESQCSGGFCAGAWGRREKKKKKSPTLRLLGEMAAGGAGARGRLDHGRVAGRHFGGEMKKGNGGSWKGGSSNPEAQQSIQYNGEEGFLLSWKRHEKIVLRQ